MEQPYDYIPEFIPYYIKEVSLFHFSDKEALLYGFIRFYTEQNRTFYFSNADLARILHASERTITRAIQKLETAGVIHVVYKQKSGGGRVRFVHSTSRHNVSLEPGGVQAKKATRHNVHKISSQLDIMSVSNSHHVYLDLPGKVQAGKNPKPLQANNKIKENKSTHTFSQSFFSQTAEDLLSWLKDAVDRDLVWRLAKEAASKTNTRVEKAVLNAAVWKFCEFHVGKRFTPSTVLFYLKRWFEQENWDRLWDTTEGAYDGLP